MTSWDPNFDLENVPDIIPVELPSPPLFKNQNDIEQRLLQSKPREPKKLIRKSDILNSNNNKKELVTGLSKSSIASNPEVELLKSNDMPTTPISSSISKLTQTSTSKSTLSSSTTDLNKAMSATTTTTTTSSDNKQRGEMREKISALRLRVSYYNN